MGPLLASPALAGLSLACYNPAKDAAGDGARYLAGAGPVRPRASL